MQDNNILCSKLCNNEISLRVNISIGKDWSEL